MKRLIALLGVLVVLIDGPAAAQGLTDADVERAIALGKQKRASSVSVRPTNWSDPFFVRLRGPFARIAQAAEEATKQYKKFDLADVTEDMRADVLTVVATGANPGSGSPAVASAVVLLPLDAKGRPLEPVQPIKVEMFPEIWANRLGAKLEGQGITGTFALSAIPAGDFFVVVVSNRRETRVRIKADKRPR